MAITCETIWKFYRCAWEPFEPKGTQDFWFSKKRLRKKKERRRKKELESSQETETTKNSIDHRAAALLDFSSLVFCFYWTFVIFSLYRIATFSMQHAVHNKVLRSSCSISEADFASDSQTRTKQSLILGADFIEMLNESRLSPSNCLVSLYCIVELSITTRNFFFFFWRVCD